MTASLVRFLTSISCLIGLLLTTSLTSHAQTFTTTGSMTTAREEYTATALQNGMVLIVGGSNGYSDFSTAELYDPSAGAFTRTGSLHTPRYWHTATLLQDGTVLIAGGYNGAYLTSAELYNPSTRTFTVTAGSMHQARDIQTATLLPSGKVLIAGGQYGGSQWGLAEAELYDPSTGTFSVTGSLNHARELHTATLLQNGEVLVVGGYNGGYLASAELYNPATGIFAATGNMSQARNCHTATLLPNGKVLIAGGQYGGAGWGLAEAELYDPTAGTFFPTGSLNHARELHTATLLYDGTVLIAGGYHGAYLATAELYNPSTGAFSYTGSMHQARDLHTAALLQNGNVLVAGGQYGGALASAEFYAPVPGITGFVNPKYVVVGVTYAPPGPQSSVTYSNSTFVGNTTTVNSSFQNDFNFSVSVTQDISAWTAVAGVGDKITNSASTDVTQGSNSSQTITTSKTSTVAYTTPGVPDPCNPVNHDYDTIWVWLNPLVLFTYYPSTGAIQWNGYGYDPNDPSGGGGRDVFPVQVGYLNGHFADNPSVDTVLARGWVTQYEQVNWPVGEGPGLTSTDKASILVADPFTNTNPPYTLPEPLPSTSADGRFTQDPYPPNPIPYQGSGGLSTMYTTVTVNTTSASQGQSYSYKQAFGTEEAFSGSTFLSGLSVDIKTTDTLTWTNSWLDTLTVTQSYTNNLTVKEGTSCTPPYSGPAQFIVFQDNHYGTFMFYPGN